MARPKKLRFKYHSEAETWQLCIQMWRWVVDQWRKTRDPIRIIKARWMDKFWGGRYIYANCFFCEAVNGECFECPGRKINSQFHCVNFTYHYEDCPDKFLKKILAMDEKRRRINRERRKK